MSLSVVRLPVADPNQLLIAELEILLEAARRGEIQRLIVCAASDDLVMRQIWRCGGSWLETVGMAATLQHSILNDDLLRQLDQVVPGGFPLHD